MIIKGCKFGSGHQFGNGIKRVCFFFGMAGQKRNVRFFYACNFIGNVHPRILVFYRLYKQFGTFFAAVPLGSNTACQGHFIQFFVNGFTVGFQNIGHDYGICQAVGRSVKAAEGMGHGVDVAHIRL